jgi:undecaprenyl-diphosphatase
LGVHWPTDVMAGWMLGAAWALVFWLVAMKVDPIRFSKSNTSA